MLRRSSGVGPGRTDVEGDRDLKVCYVLRQFPAVSQTFVREEVAALRKQGVTVMMSTVFPPAEHEVISDQARAERDEMIVLWRPMRVAVAVVLAFLRHPTVTWQVLRIALRDQAGGVRGVSVRLSYFGLGLRLARLVRRSGCSHLHAHFLDISSDAAMIASEYDRRLRREYTGWSVTIHGPLDFLERREMKPWHKLESCDFAVCISDFGQGMMMYRCPAEVWDKLTVVHCGVRLDRLSALTRVRPKDPVLVCTGRLAPQKGQKILLQAMAMLAARGIDAKLQLVGDGLDREMLEAECARLGITDRVEFLGSVPPAEVFERVRQATAFVLPSFAEGIPIALMEAMAIGVPVIATRTFGTPELIEDGVSGHLVTPSRADQLADAIADVLADPDRAEAMTAIGRETVKREFDIDETARRLRELFTVGLDGIRSR